MEDLWCVQNSGVEVEDFADVAEYNRFLKRFCNDVEKEPQGELLIKEVSHDC